MELTAKPSRRDRIPGPSVEIESDRLLLRSMTETDATPAYTAWMNDPDIVRYTESRFVSHSTDDVRHYISTINNDPNSLLLAMITRADSRHIGNIKIGPIDWWHRSGDIGLLIGDTNCWGNGYGSEAIAALSGFALGSLELEKLTAGVYAPNIGCMRAFERAGFQQEGIRRDQCRFEDRRVDVILMGRTLDDHL